MRVLITYTNIGGGFKSPAFAVAKELTRMGVKTKIVGLPDDVGDTFGGWLLRTLWEIILRVPFTHSVVIIILDSKFVNSRVGDIILERVLFLKIITGLNRIINSWQPDAFFSSCGLTPKTIRAINKKQTHKIPYIAYNPEVFFFPRVYANPNALPYFTSTEDGRIDMISNGTPRKHVQIVGYPVDQKFARAKKSAVSARKALGLREQFTILLFSGSTGVGGIEEFIKEIVKEDFLLQAIVVCGRNKKLLLRIRAIQSTNVNIVALGYVENLEEYLSACDVMCGKAGISSVFEAIYMQKPLVITKAMENEQFAVKHIVKKKIGSFTSSPHEFAALIRDLSKKGSTYKQFIKNLNHLRFSPGGPIISQTIINQIIQDRRTTFAKTKWILLDLADTLCAVDIHSKNWNRINQEGCIAAFRIAGLDKDLSQNLFTHAVKSFVSCKSELRSKAKKDLREYPLKEQLRNFFENPPKNIQKKDLTPAMLSRMEQAYVTPELSITKAFPNVRKVLKSLKKRYRLALISNNVSSNLVYRTLKSENIDRLFSVVIVSAEIGYRKPHPKYLQAVFRRLSVGAKDCTLVGDRLNQDITLGHASGMTTIHIAAKTHEDNEGLEHIIPDFRVYSLDELEELLLYKKPARTARR